MQNISTTINSTFVRHKVFEGIIKRAPNDSFRMSTFIAFLYFSVFMLAAGTITAQTKTWTGSTNNLWTVSTNWSPAGVPTSANDVIIPHQDVDVGIYPVIPVFYVAHAASMHIEANTELSIKVSGRLIIDNFSSFALKNDGLLTNQGIIQIGLSSLNNLGIGIENYGTIDNRRAIEIANILNHNAIFSQGNIYNNSTSSFIGVNSQDAISGAFAIHLEADTLTNHGAIWVGRSKAVRSGIKLTGTATFINEIGAEVTIDSTDAYAIQADQNVELINGGEIAIGSISPVGTDALLSGNGIQFFAGAYFMNQATGIVKIDHVEADGNSALFLLGSTTILDNFGTIEIGTTGGIDGSAIRIQSSEFNNHLGAQLIVDRSEKDAIQHSSGTFNNYSEIIIGSNVNLTVSALSVTFGDFNNLGCGSVLHCQGNNEIDEKPTTSGSLLNEGTIIDNYSGTSSVTTNNGIIQNLNGGTITIGSGNAAITNAGTHWTGCQDSLWNNAMNWTLGIPTSIDEAIVLNRNIDPVIVAGATALARSIDININAQLSIEDSGTLTIDGSLSSGIVVNGTLDNAGTLSIGENSPIASNGLTNLGLVTNRETGEIHIGSSSGAAALYAEFVTSSFTNFGLIKIGSMGTAVRGIFSNALFTNKESGQIYIDNTLGDAIEHIGGGTRDFVNEGLLHIGQTNTIGIMGIRNTGDFINESSGEIRIDRTSSHGISSEDEFENSGNIIIGEILKPGGDGITSFLGQITNEFGGMISIIDVTDYAINAFSLPFNNHGGILIGASSTSIGNGIGINNTGDFLNDECAIIHIVSNNRINSTDDFINDGTIIENASGSSDIEYNNATGFIRNQNGGTFSIDVSNTGSITTGTTKVVNWTGCVDTLWDNPLNWDNLVIPNFDRQVRIGNVANDPIIPSGFAGEIASLWVKNNAVLTLRPNSELTLERDGSEGGHAVSLDGTIQNEGTIDISSDTKYTLAISNNGGVLNNDGGIINIDNVVEDGIINKVNSTIVNSNGGKLLIGQDVGYIGRRGIYHQSLTPFINDAILKIDHTGSGLPFSSGIWIDRTFINSSNGQFLVGTNGGNNKFGILVGRDNSPPAVLRNDGGLIKVHQSGKDNTDEQGHLILVQLGGGLENINGGVIELDSMFTNKFDAIRIHENPYGNNFNSTGSKILIGLKGNVAGDGIIGAGNNKTQFNNLSCGLIKSKDKISLNATSTNDAYIIDMTSQTGSIGTNSGFIQNLNGGGFNVTTNAGGFVSTNSDHWWGGCMDDDWMLPENWVHHTLPVFDDDVILWNKAAVHFDPVLRNAPAQTIKSLTLKSFTSLSVESTGELNVEN